MRLSEFKIAKLLCRLFDHKWDEFHMYEVVCSRCRLCRPYTEEDNANLECKQRAREDSGERHVRAELKGKSQA